MMNSLSYKESLVFKALEMLDEELYKMRTIPFELNVIGGFALMVESIRFSDRTDIDYVGNSLPKDIKIISDEIGLKLGLGRGWLNNDVMLADSSLEDLEWSTGELKFRKAFELAIITVNVLDKSCLLRMKVIAVDTSYSAIEYGGEFTRQKDFEDIRLLMSDLNIDMKELKRTTESYTICPETYRLIGFYLEHKDISLYYTNDIVKIANGEIR